MGTLVLDFDSTLVPCESLELLLDERLAGDAVAREQVAEITRLGMEGEIGFRESLEQRLRIAQPDRGAAERVGRDLAGRLTAGARDVVAAVLGRGHAVWIVSGAFREVLLPTAAALGIPPVRVLGVRPLWGPGGAFAGLDPDDACSTSKVAGVLAAAPDWPRPAVGLGDGMTDHALLEAGLVDHFIAYTEHAQRASVLSTDVPAAADMVAVGGMLETLLR